EGTGEMGYKASLKTLEKSGIPREEIDFIIFATLSPDYTFPGSGCLMQEMLDLPGIGALDVRNQCCGFIYGLSIADQYIKTGMYNCVLVVGSEVHSTGLDLSTTGRDLAVLFGDGAGAAILVPSEDNESGILSTHLHADGRHIKELWVECPGSIFSPRINHKMIDEGRHYPKMNGRQVFKYAVSKFPKVIMAALETNGLSIEDVKLVIPHQANQRITEAVAHKLKISMDKVFSNIHKYGNTTAASIPIALDEALEEGRIKKGDLIILAAFGSGFTWASAAIRW
ncbi:MAG: 3-oxoacyl-ACP synthase III family protein, partial [Fidelibacterota bacterium]